MAYKDEVWKKIEGFEYYYVSNYGEVKSVKNNKEIILEPIMLNTYLVVSLSKNGKKKNYRIHRLVAKYFCEGYEEDKDCHHINLIKVDNRACNLLCLTKSEHHKLHAKLEKESAEKNSADSFIYEKEN